MNSFISFVRLGMWISCVISAISLMAGIVSFSTHGNRIKNWIPCDGYVDRFIEMKGVDYTYFAPVMHYSHEGHTYQYEFTEGMNPPQYKIGDRVEILLNPRNLNEATIKAGGAMHRFLFANSALVMLLAGICAVASRILSRRNNSESS